MQITETSMQTKRIVITGASGFLGNEIHNILKHSDVDLILVGRNKLRLQEQYPNDTVIEYNEIPTIAKKADALIHLAIHNNDKENSMDDFRKVNVEFLCDVANLAEKGGIKKFINISTFHTHNKNSLYAASKRDGDAALSLIKGINVITFRVPAIYGTKYKGNLAVLYLLPRLIRPICFNILSALKPTLSAQKLVSEILSTISAPESDQNEILISDQQEGNYIFHGVKRLVDMSVVR